MLLSKNIYCSFFSLLLVFGLASVFFNSSHAQENAIKGCYNMEELKGVSSPPIEKELLVILDQTVAFDKKLQEEAFKKIKNFLTPGTKLVVVKFSAYDNNQYTEIILHANVSVPMTNRQRRGIRKNPLKNFDRCIKQEPVKIHNAVADTIISTYKESNDNAKNIGKTNIIPNLIRIAKKIIRPVDDDRERYLFIFSDMIENSEVTSFYKTINPEHEFSKIEKNYEFPDFRGSKVYVLGGGYSPKGQRSEKMIDGIRDFWEKYFSVSNATLEAFGSPTLLVEIGD